MKYNSLPLLYICVSIILVGCTEISESNSNPEAQLSIESNPSSSGNLKENDQVEKTTVEASTLLLKSEDRDYSIMSEEELDAELIKIREIISRIEIDMDTFPDDDPRWDSLFGWNERIIEISREKTLREKQRTRKSRLLLGED